jgi:hypothetical protein
MRDRECAAVEVARIRVDAAVAVEARLDHDAAPEPERGAVRKVVFVEVLQEGHGAAELDRTRRVEVLPRVAEPAAAQCDRAVGAFEGFGQQHLQPVRVCALQHRGATRLRTQQGGEIARRRLLLGDGR